MALVVFTDLDGTLLDHHDYSWQAARPALAALKAAGAELVPCSSKTRAELLLLWDELGLAGPLISENGGGVFLPEAHVLAALPGWRPAGPGWLAHPLGLGIAEVRRRLAVFKDIFGLRGFGEMSDQEVADLTGLDPRRAGLARRREFNEPLLPASPALDGQALAQAARQACLAITRGGRFLHALGGGDKGRAVALLSDMYRQGDPALLTAGLGDAPNDQGLLAAVDRPFLVARPDGSHADIDLPGLVRVPLSGPAGWNRAVLSLLEELS